MLPSAVPRRSNVRSMTKYQNKTPQVRLAFNCLLLILVCVQLLCEMIETRSMQCCTRKPSESSLRSSLDSTDSRVLSVRDEQLPKV